ncbi:MAG: relaxase/mobilization nuclease domain-containing protein [Bifidobacterium pseudocatenulatum]
MAEAITGGEYRYVVSTHLDRNHLHNHIVICAANRRTRRKMRLTRGSIDQWRAVSDESCRREDWPRSTILRSMRKPGDRHAADHGTDAGAGEHGSAVQHHQKWSP